MVCKTTISSMQKYAYNSTLRLRWNRIELLYFGFRHAIMCTKSFADKISASMICVCYVYLDVDACNNYVIPFYRQTYIYIYIYIYIIWQLSLIYVDFRINVVKLCLPLSKLDLPTLRKGCTEEWTQRNK